MAFGPINRKPGERTTVRERAVANKAKYINVQEAGRGLESVARGLEAQAGGWGSIAKAFSSFAGKVTAEQEEAELLKDQQALDKLYLDIQRNPEAANAASRSGDWSAFSINERMNRPSIAKMMPTIAGQSMGMGITKDALKAIQHLGPTDDPQAFLNSFIAKELQGIENPTIERSVYDMVTKGTARAVGQQRQIMIETFNAKQLSQSREVLNGMITDGSSMKDIMAAMKLQASGMQGNLAENFTSIKEQVASQVLHLSQAGEDKSTRLAATKLLTEETPEFGGPLLSAMDPIKIQTILRQSRELAKSRDKAATAETYKELNASIAYAKTAAEAQAAWNQALANSSKTGISASDPEMVRLYEKIQARYKREGATSAILRGETVSIDDANDYIEDAVKGLASGQRLDVDGFIRGVANTTGKVRSEVQGAIANILRSETPQAYELFKAVAAVGASNLTHRHNVDIESLLPNNSPVIPQIAYMMAREIKSSEDMKEAQVAWAESMQSAFNSGVPTQNAARTLFKSKTWVEADENVVDEFLDMDDNRANLAKHWGVDESALEPGMALATRVHIEERLNYAAAGASLHKDLTKEQFTNVVSQFIGKPTFAIEHRSDGSQVQVPVNPGPAVVDGEHTTATPAQIDPAHKDKTFGSGVGLRPNNDGSSSVIQPDFTGNDSPVILIPGEPFIIPSEEMAERLREGGRSVYQRDDGTYTADPLPDAPVGTKGNITEDGTLYFERTEQGWEIRTKGAYLQQRPENEGFLMKAFRMLGWAPEVGTVDKPTIDQLKKRAEDMDITTFHQKMADAYARRGDYSAARRAQLNQDVTDDMLESAGEELMKLVPQPGTAGTPSEGPAAIDVQQEKRAVRASVAAAVDAGQAHPDALHLVDQYGEKAVDMANKENNYIPNKQRLAMTTLENIMASNPMSNYKPPGVASHIGESEVSKVNNPAALPNQEFTTPTEGIQAAQDHFTKVWSEGARTIRAMLNGKTKMPDGAEGTPAGFVSKMWNTPQLHDVAKELGVKPEYIIAQAALESGWGKHIKGNALFGIKGEGQTFTTHEYIDGKKVVMDDSFRAYDSWGDSIKDYGELLKSRSHYSGALNAKTGKEYFGGLKAGGYATDPKYVEKLSEILQSTHIQDAVRSMTEGDTPENEVAVVARNAGVDPDTPVDMNDPEVRTKVLQGVIEARQGTSEGRTWKPYVREVVEGRPAEMPSTGTGDTVTGHGYRFDWPDTQVEMSGLGIRDINKITPEQHKILTATRINNIMSNYPQWLPGVTMDDTKRQALTEYLYHSPWNEELGRPAFLTQRLMHSLKHGKWNRVAREIAKETRVFKQNLNGPQKDAARFLTKMQRQALADKFMR